MQDVKVVYGRSINFIPASHEDKDNPGVYKKVLYIIKDLTHGNVQMINWARLPKGKSFQSHYHEDMQEIFIITDGRVSVVVNNKQYVLEKGDAIAIAPKVIHEMTNIGLSEVNYVVIGISEFGKGKTVIS